MKLIKGIALSIPTTEREVVHLGETIIHVAQSYERQSQSAKIQNEVCVGVVKHTSLPDLPVGTIALFIYGFKQTELPDGTFWMNESAIIGTLVDGKLKGYGKKVLGFSITNADAEELGYLQHSPLFRVESWKTNVYSTGEYTLFKPYDSDRLLFKAKGMVGQQVVDWEMVGVSNQPRTVFFADKEDCHASTIEAPDLKQSLSARYNHMELKSNIEI